MNVLTVYMATVHVAICKMLKGNGRKGEKGKNIRRKQKLMEYLCALPSNGYAYIHNKRVYT